MSMSMSKSQALRFLFERHCLLRTSGPVLLSAPTSSLLPSLRNHPLNINPRFSSWSLGANSCRYSMVHRIPPSHSSERARKRRRISTTAPHEGVPEAMENPAQTPAQTPQPLVTFQLTPLETTLKELLLDVAQYIHNRAIATGASEADTPHMVLRFTGGWVRDKLLGVDSHDIDVGISSMTGYQFGMALKTYLDDPENLEKYKRNHPNGELKEAIVSLHKIEANPEKSKHLETVTTKIFGLDIDLVNLRKETYTDESRNPQMEFGTAEEDAMRRDATINALFYNLNESKVEDFTGRGFEDMRNKIIRTPLEPYQTFKDDPLRVLRLIRFASRLGYNIDANTQLAMQNSDISTALKQKISKERVGTELEKMLKGPDPRGALHLIDQIGLYPTIFANNQDDATADTSSWSLAYNALETLLHHDEALKPTLEKVRNFLIRDAQETYYAWIITALAPWSSVAGRVAKGPKAKPLPPRSVEVARDSLRSDNKTLSVLGDAATNWNSIIDVKSSLLEGRIEGTDAEVRQQIALHMRSWKKDWRLCMVLAILQEIMKGREILPVAQEYDQLISYIVKNDLQDVCEMKPMVNGAEVMKAMGAKNGPWLSKALDLVIKWQLLHPEITEKEKALEYVLSRKDEFGL
ncbi:tRNA adenylyltransferase [Aspergillus clavatus NRRL 1]|uniref:Poly(A) polymerase n=1 Tax=Aspergillus clavatus (strain ATCC 1007 / CBS 513.65 / DSM 816 / NCTC 3887 / NRRL 1 / QM 1276 / 107) TaxID=344612 RepID=A1C7Z8_ASPCL|nr:poly(A) polymerase [Aspergillus clavatus NRRL 1]EAW14519.1 poly(A) polymerase [Aspergillus clavatus NRRL 1]